MRSTPASTVSESVRTVTSGDSGRLVRIRDPGEVGDLPRQRLLVEPLHVAGDERLQAGLGVHLEERDARLGGQPPHLVARLAYGEMAAAIDPHLVLGQHPRHVADAPDVLLAVRAG